VAPGLVEMGQVTPLYRLDPDIGEALRRLAHRRDPGVFLRYSDPHGLPEHREAGAAWARRYGLDVGAEEIVVCAGAQHALTCCLAGLFQSGQRIATGCLTYPGFKSLAVLLGLRLTPIPMDEFGMTAEGLDAACRRSDIHGLYLMPGVHNPTTIRMPAERRAEIAAVAERHGLTIIEDDAYDLTSPDEIAPVASLARERSVYVAGVSKALAAGLRVAFVVAPPRFRKALTQAVLSTVWMAPPLNVELVAGWIMDGTAGAIVRAKREEARRRHAVAAEVLAGRSFRGQPTGFFLWLDLPRPWSGAVFEARARERGVNLFGAEKFVVGDAPAPAAARLSLTGAPALDELRRGLSLLRDLLEDDTPDMAALL